MHYQELVADNWNGPVFGRLWYFKEKEPAKEAAGNIGNIVIGGPHNHGFSCWFANKGSDGNIFGYVLGTIFPKNPLIIGIAAEIEKVVVNIYGGIPIENHPELEFDLLRHVLDVYEIYLAHKGAPRYSG